LNVGFCQKTVRVVPGKLLQVEVERELRSAVLHLREDLHQRDGVIVTLDVPPDAYRGAGDVAACNEVTEVAAVVGANPLLVRTHDVAEPVEHRPVIHRRLKVALHSLDPLCPPSPFFLAELHATPFLDQGRT